ncbi:MAG TPA: hypothetical protein VFI29_13300 [Hanamia sp.]|nr:hypothetical protein [Hanamia sp.]
MINLILGTTKSYAQVSRKNPSFTEHIIYLENNEIKVGVNLDLGGSITYLSIKNKDENLINNFDWGRQIQMSFYGGPNPYMPYGKEPNPYWKTLGWNPIQSGDYAGNRSIVIDHKQSSTEIYVKCIPMQWPLNNVPCNCTFESWIRLDKNTVLVRSRLNNNRKDSIQYAGKPQELPAVYTNAPFTQLVTYRGQKPFQNDTVSQIKNENIPGSGRIDWASWQATENWAATLDTNNWGLGVWHPEVQRFKGGFFGKKGSPGNSFDKPTAYIAPGFDEILDRNIIYTYNYVLIPGSLEEIRKYVYQHSIKDRLPKYTFSNDRQHWIYQNTTDLGWPIRGYLEVKLSKGAALLGPLSFWHAKKSHHLIIRAAYKTKSKKTKVCWQLFGEDDFRKTNNVEFNINSDQKFETYDIPLGHQAGYEGNIIRLKIIPSIGSNEKGDWVRIQSIVIR